MKTTNCQFCGQSTGSLFMDSCIPCAISMGAHDNTFPTHALQLKLLNKQPRFRPRALLAAIQEHPGLLLCCSSLETHRIKIREQILHEIRLLTQQQPTSVPTRLTKHGLPKANPKLENRPQQYQGLITAYAQDTGNFCFYCGDDVTGHPEIESVFTSPFEHNKANDCRRANYIECARMAGTIVIACTRCNQYKAKAENQGLSFFRGLTNGTWSPCMAGDFYNSYSGEIHTAPQQINWDAKSPQHSSHATLTPDQKIQVASGLLNLSLRLYRLCTHNTRQHYIFWQPEIRSLAITCEQCKLKDTPWTAAFVRSAQAARLADAQAYYAETRRMMRLNFKTARTQEKGETPSDAGQ